MRPCISIRACVRRSIGPSVRPSVGNAFVKNSHSIIAFQCIRPFHAFLMPSGRIIGCWASLWNPDVVVSYVVVITFSMTNAVEAEIRLDLQSPSAGHSRQRPTNTTTTTTTTTTTGTTTTGTTATTSCSNLIYEPNQARLQHQQQRH